MDIIIKAFQTYYKLPELLSTECDWVQWTNNIEIGSSENLMCPSSKLEENAKKILLETNKSFENLLITLIKYHFEKGTIKNFNNPVEYEDSYNLILDLAKDKQLQNLYNFSLYDHWPVKTYIYSEVIYISQFVDHVFKTLYSIFRSLNKASIKSYNILEKRKPTKLINEKTDLEKQHEQLLFLITNAIQGTTPNDTINKLVIQQNLIKSKIQDLDNKIVDYKLKELTNRIDQNIVLGDKYINGFVYNIDIIIYLAFINTETIPIELFDRINTQLKITNSKFITFLISKFHNVIKNNKICYINKSDIEEFEKQQISSKAEQLKSLLTSKTVSSSHKLQALLTKFIPLSDPLAESILYSIIQKLGFGNRLSF